MNTKKRKVIQFVIILLVVAMVVTMIMPALMMLSLIHIFIIQNIKQKKIRIFFVFIACAIQTAILIRFKYTDFIIQSVNSCLLYTSRCV